MVDVMSIQGAILGLKTAADIAKGFLQLQSMAEVQGKVIDLQSSILAAQSSALAAQSEQSLMIQQVRDLEEEVARVKAWEGEKQRYQLVAPWPGYFVYALRESCKGTEPPHWICEHYYQEGREFMLHNTYKDNNRRIAFIKCSHCGSEHETMRVTERKYA